MASMEFHRQNAQVHHRPWQVQVTRLTQLPDCCNHAVVDVALKDIRYLGSYSKIIYEHTNRHTHMLTKQSKFKQILILN